MKQVPIAAAVVFAKALGELATHIKKESRCPVTST
jgi:hypothetical protein